MEIKVLTDSFGVEITKFDCSQNIDLEDINVLKDLIQSKHFICFKISGKNMLYFFSFRF